MEMYKAIIIFFILSFPSGAANTPKYSLASSKQAAPIIKAAERNGIKYLSDDWFLLMAIRKAENGGKGREWGIMNPKANTEELQAAWCAATIMKNHKRYGNGAVTEDYISFLGSRYCPVGADNDPKGLNKNWIKNVTYWFHKLRGEK